MIRVLLALPNYLIPEAYPLLTDLLPGFDIVSLAVDEDVRLLADTLRTSNFLICSELKISREMLVGARQLKLVQKWGSGVDGIDVSAARSLGIPVANVPGGNSIAVAEHFFALLLALYKKICPANASIQSGQWWQAELVNEGIKELQGETIGLVGLGHIGRAIASRAQAFGMKTIYYKRVRLSLEEEHQLQVSFTDLPSLACQADIVGLVLPLSDETRGLFNRKLLMEMKQSAVIINVSRGGILNEDDLNIALEAGRIAGAGLDVFSEEPSLPSFQLLSSPKVVATPHIAGRSKKAMRYITEQCAINVVRVLHDENPCNLVSHE
jgi:phosphoglycerate dehydrogenase-like enzyme